MVLGDLSDYLTSGGIASVTIYQGFLPDIPDKAMAIYEIPGLPAVHAMNAAAGAALVERPGVQFVVRDVVDEYATARTAIDAVWKLIDGLPSRSINGVAYKWAMARQSPFTMGRDESGRVLLTFSADVWKALS